MAIRALDIAAYLGKNLIGLNRDVITPCSLNQCCDGGLVFLKKYDEIMLNVLSKQQNITAIVSPEYDGKLLCSYIISKNPRLDFARVVREFFSPLQQINQAIASTAVIGRNVVLGKEVIIGEYSVIGDNVVIGDYSEIHHHVVINAGARIGSECRIKSNTVIGEDGFGFERDEKGIPIGIPHLGGVVIGDNVEIGALNTIVRGTLDDTIINNNTKTDDHVHIAHNVYIGENCLIAACAEISGSAYIGNNCWLGPNSSIMNGIRLGDNCFVGLGAVVTQSFSPNVVVAGCPARVLRKNN